jgi:hypothetical protein
MTNKMLGRLREKPGAEKDQNQYQRLENHGRFTGLYPVEKRIAPPNAWFAG